MHRWKGGRGSYLYFPLPDVYNFRLNTALSLTCTHWSSAISPPTQSLTYHVYSLGLESWAEGRTSHHKYSRRQLAIISHHAINDHILQLLSVPLWSYLDSRCFP